MKIRTKKHLAPIMAIIIFQMALIVLVHTAIAGSGQPDKRQANRPYETETEAGLANCRYGVATLGTDQVDWVDDLGAGWYLTFGVNTANASNSAEFVPLISVHQNKDINGNYLSTFSVNPPLTESGLGNLIDARPHALWIVGNEVDRGPDPGQIQGGQGDTYPVVYAKAYHQIYQFIKQRDPSAQVANSALVQVTPGRLQYMDLMWDAYKANFGAIMPVDVWNMHLYILPEANPAGQPNAIANIALGTNPALAKKESGGNGALCPQSNIYCIAEHDSMAIFHEQVIAMRTWMAAHGQRDKPLILSEFSLLYPYQIDGPTCYLQDEFGNCFTPTRVNNFLNSTLPYLRNTVSPTLGYPKDGNRLIQQSLWFSVNNQGGVGNVSDLVRNNALTTIGQSFKAFVQAEATNKNLYVDHTNNPTGTTGGGGTANVKLTVTMRNGGNVAPATTFYVTFYKDAALTQPIGTASIAAPSPANPGMTGCSRLTRTATVNWNNLAPGVHKYWVKLDSTNAVVETSEGDNVGSGTVFINPNQSYVPVVSRYQ